MHEKEGWAVLIVVAVGAGALIFAASRAIGQVLALQSSDTSASMMSGTSLSVPGWQTYQNSDFNFSIQYPSDWQVSSAGLAGANPFIAIGDPLDGTSTYSVQIFIEDNPSQLDSGEYVHELLASDRVQDAANASAAGGPTPLSTPQYEKSFLLNTGAYPAYELSNVFEFDHNAEQIYVAHDNIALRFDFPIAQENPNINLPVAHNAIAHEIVQTLKFGN
jgi:hypothetical protein